MNITIPEDMVQAIANQVQYRRISVEEAVREALSEWLESEKEMKAELDMWQAARLETLQRVEESLD